MSNKMFRPCFKFGFTFDMQGIKKTRLTCMEKEDREEFWTHLAGRASCTIELSSDWLNPHSHPVNNDNNQQPLQDMGFGYYILSYQ